MIGQQIDVEVKGELPFRGSLEATGYDIRVDGDYVIRAGKSVMMKTKTSVSVPENVVCLAIPRSGICKIGLMLLNSVGLIDPDFTGYISLPYQNITEEDIYIKDEERLGQLVFMPSLIPNFIPVVEFSKTTERGENGFGHSGRV